MRHELLGLAAAAMRFTDAKSIFPILALLLLSAPVCAHHTADSLDFDTTIELSGEVKEFLWTNPYAALRLEVSGENGARAEWLLDLASPGALTRRGWNATTLEPGDTVTVNAYPVIDGSPGGRAISVTLPDGTITEQ